ncbi:MAG: oligosaccharide flippase family protein [Pseudomonadota bacterium]
MLRSVLLLLSGNAATALVTLTRNLIIARLISVENYGIAATFAIALGVVELLSALGMEQQIVQARDGDTTRFQAALQAFTVLRGAVSSALLFAIAAPMADFLGVPDLTWAYQIMALTPLIRAFVHYDKTRFKRSMRYGPEIATRLGSAALAVVAVWPAYLIWGDYRVMMASMLVQTFASIAMSHLFAERPYRLVFDVAIWRGSLKFGWPLLVNGILLFGVMHGEKLIAGRTLGLEDLAILAMGLTLTMTPTLVLARSLQDFFLPQLSAARDDAAAFQRLAETAIETVMSVTLVYLLAMVALGGPVALLLLGEKYAALPPLVVLLAVQQSLRVFKAGGSVVAVARGQTTNPMIANAVRLAALPVAWWVAVNGGGLDGIIYVAIAGEALGFLVSLAMIRLRLRIRMRRLRLSFLVSALAVAVGLAGALGADPAAAATLTRPLEIGAVALAVGLALAMMRGSLLYVLGRARPGLAMGAGKPGGTAP